MAKDTPFPGVVPANAGTHTPRPRVWAGWLTASAKQHLWLWVPAFAGTTSTALIRSFSFQSTVLANTASRSRRLFRARFAVEFPPSAVRGRRECRAPGAPAAACAVVESTRVSHHGHTGNTRHSPRNGFNGFLRALPGDRACLPPSPRNAKHCRELMPASGHQDHTTSPSAIAPFVIGSIRVHRIPPRVRDDRETPLLSRRDGASW